MFREMLAVPLHRLSILQFAGPLCSFSFHSPSLFIKFYIFNISTILRKQKQIHKTTIGMRVKFSFLSYLEREDMYVIAQY